MYAINACEVLCIRLIAHVSACPAVVNGGRSVHIGLAAVNPVAVAVCPVRAAEGRAQAADAGSGAMEIGAYYVAAAAVVDVRRGRLLAAVSWVAVTVRPS